MNNDLMFSSKKDDWETPQWLFDELDAEFGFDLDAAASFENRKCSNYWSGDEEKRSADSIDCNALTNQWQGNVFCNPPYSRGLQKKFIEKAHDEHFMGHTSSIVMLLPARTDTIAFHEYIYGKAEIRFLKGRLKFEVNGVPAKDPAPFPSMVVIYR
jgi:site-specific DNA-methyltransferase (adenine-specific)